MSQVLYINHYMNFKMIYFSFYMFSLQCKEEWDPSPCLKKSYNPVPIFNKNPFPLHILDIFLESSNKPSSFCLRLLILQNNYSGTTE